MKSNVNGSVNLYQLFIHLCFCHIWCRGERVFVRKILLFFNMDLHVFLLEIKALSVIFYIQYV